ncbi:putative ABC transporter ATP-binding protein [Clostridia bacterium]|nr:putative ABC transporter ATP-binding protein [Clostridia bacterium]
MMIDKRLIAMVGGVKKYIAGNIVFQWLSLAANAGMVFSLAMLFERLIETGDASGMLPVTIGVFLLAAAVRYICGRFAVNMSHLASVRVKEVLRVKIYEKMLSLGGSYTKHVHTAEVLQVAGEGVEQLEVYFGKYLPQLFYSLLAPLTLFLILAFVNIPVAVVLLLSVPLILLSVAAVSKLARKVYAKYWGVYTDLGAGFLENIQGLTTLKIYKADARRHEEMRKDAETFRKITMKVLTMQLCSVTVMDVIAYGGAAAGIIMGVLSCRAGSISIMGCIAIILLAAEFFIPMRLFGSYFHIAMNGMTACKKIFKLLDIPEAKEKTEALRPSPDGPVIDVSGLTFRYEEVDVLKDISLSIPGRGLIAVVGESGCGKSTLAGVLAGKLSGYDGEITLGGKSLSEIAERSLHEHTTLVGANSHIFKGTVRENLSSSNKAAGDREMWDALRRVKLSDFLAGEAGLDTPVSENAANLSGGQRQRLALARALLHDSAVYIFDEATSNIDAESEGFIMDVIRELALEKSVLLISHRLANVNGADCIYVLKSGNLTEFGMHEDLMAGGGTYAELYLKQTELEDFVPTEKRWAYA